jgi:hypothetical protein
MGAGLRYAGAGGAQLQRTGLTKCAEPPFGSAAGIAPEDFKAPGFKNNSPPFPQTSQREVVLPRRRSRSSLG